MAAGKDAFILWFDELSIDDVPLVGGKNASLGEMYRNLTSKGVSVPNGFAVTAHAYHYLLEKAGIRGRIKDILSDLNVSNMKNLAERGLRVRETILQAEFPEELNEAIIEAYGRLCKRYGKDADVAVRSSDTAEDLPDASFAGQQETYLNIRGYKDVIKNTQKCWASLFESRAIFYRVENGYSHLKVGIAVPIQLMVQSDFSGIMFTVNPLTNNEGEISI